MNTAPVEGPPWEVSVFAALLKMRWAYFNRNSGHQPDAVNPLDAEPETALGDVLLTAQDRLFMLELKASWRRTSSEADKPIFRRYQMLHSRARRSGDLTGFEELMLLSVRCHHLVYWEDLSPLSKQVVRGTISFSPYVLFVLDRLLGENVTEDDFRRSHALIDLISGSKTVVEAASAQGMFSGVVKAASGDLVNGNNVNESDLGLNQAEFLNFVKMLHENENAGNLPLKLIAFSPISGFTRYVASLKDAIKLGNDWLGGTASSKPEGKCGARAGTARVLGSFRLACSPPSLSALGNDTAVVIRKPISP